MSSQRGNVVRTRSQRHQNAEVFRNDKHDTSTQRKCRNCCWRTKGLERIWKAFGTQKGPLWTVGCGYNKIINAKLHEGLCQRCKEVLEWRVKFNKYKPLTKPKKCVKCLQKTVKDSYHTVCKPCACELDLCAKCGKREEILIPIQTSSRKTENQPAENDQQRKSTRDNPEDGDELNLGGLEDDDGVDVLMQRIKNLKPERTEVQ